MPTQCPLASQGCRTQKNAFISPPFSPGCLSLKIMHYLDQGSANFLCKKPCSKYSRLCRLYGPCHNYSTLSLQHISSLNRMQTNECGSVSIKFYLRMLKYEFYIFPVSQNIPLLILFNHRKTIFGLQTVQNTQQQVRIGP